MSKCAKYLNWQIFDFKYRRWYTYHHTLRMRAVETIPSFSGTYVALLLYNGIDAVSVGTLLDTCI